MIYMFLTFVIQFQVAHVIQTCTRVVEQICGFKTHEYEVRWLTMLLS